MNDELRGLKMETAETIAPTEPTAASRRSFMQFVAGTSALLATGSVALTATRASAATNVNTVPSNEEIIRRAYALAEMKPSPDLQGWIDAFTPEGTFTNEASGITYRGKDLALQVDFMAKAFPDIHRELFHLYSVGDMVIVELSINGTNTGPMGANAPTGRKMTAPCCDVFTLKDGKIVSFHCYPLVQSPSSWKDA